MKKDNLQLTPAQLLFGGKEILTSRPEGMGFAAYRVLLYTQSKLLRKLFKHKPSRKIAGLMPVKLGYNLHIIR